MALDRWISPILLIEQFQFVTDVLFGLLSKSDVEVRGSDMYSGTIVGNDQGNGLDEEFNDAFQFECGLQSVGQFQG